MNKAKKTSLLVEPMGSLQDHIQGLREEGQRMPLLPRKCLSSEGCQLLQFEESGHQKLRKRGMAAGNWTDFEEKKRKELPFNLVCPVQLKHVAPTFLPPCWALEGMGSRELLGLFQFSSRQVYTNTRTNPSQKIYDSFVFVEGSSEKE